MERNKTLVNIVSSSTQRRLIQKKPSLPSVEYVSAINPAPLPEAAVRLRGFLKSATRSSAIKARPAAQRHHIVPASEKKPETRNSPSRRATSRERASFCPRENDYSMLRLPGISYGDDLGLTPGAPSKPDETSAECEALHGRVERLERELRARDEVIRQMRNENDYLRLEVTRLRVREKRGCETGKIGPVARSVLSIRLTER